MWYMMHMIHMIRTHKILGHIFRAKSWVDVGIHKRERERERERE